MIRAPLIIAKESLRFKKGISLLRLPNSIPMISHKKAMHKEEKKLFCFFISS